MKDYYEMTEYASNEGAYPMSAEQSNDVIGDLQNVGQSLSALVHYQSVPLMPHKISLVCSMNVC